MIGRVSIDGAAVFHDPNAGLPFTWTAYIFGNRLEFMETLYNGRKSWRTHMKLVRGP